MSCCGIFPIVACKSERNCRFRDGTAIVYEVKRYFGIPIAVASFGQDTECVPHRCRLLRDGQGDALAAFVCKRLMPQTGEPAKKYLVEYV